MLRAGRVALSRGGAASVLSARSSKVPTGTLLRNARRKQTEMVRGETWPHFSGMRKPCRTAFQARRGVALTRTCSTWRPSIERRGRTATRSGGVAGAFRISSWATQAVACSESRCSRGVEEVLSGSIGATQAGHLDDRRRCSVLGWATQPDPPRFRHEEGGDRRAGGDRQRAGSDVRAPVAPPCGRSSSTIGSR